MPAKVCTQCASPDLFTDYTAGNILCQTCGYIVEEGILVSEVGFAEGSGGRVHVQGTFVSTFSTGIAGFHGRKSGQQSSESVKAQGQQRIQSVARQMDLGHAISSGAARTFALAVDQRFNKGRRTEYLIASCLYLQCRMMQDHHMLIDFAERLGVNVYELAHTYLKLRAILHLDKAMPEVDPAIYNLHFAKRLDFGTSTNIVATDASRLVRRFKADWMTQGRRPAGVCGACLIIAGRMNNFMRTPEEVAQVVKASPYTIRRRLREFARSRMAEKTVAEWRKLRDEELDVGEEDVPPIVKQQRERAQRLEAERKLLQLERENEAAKALGGEVENGEEGQGEGDEGGRSGKRQKENGRTLEGVLEELQGEAGESGSGDGDRGDEEEEEDSLAPLGRDAYAEELVEARDNPEEAFRERQKAKRDLHKERRALLKSTEVTQDIVEEIAAEAEAQGNEQGEEENEKGDEDDDELREIDEREEGEGLPRKKEVEFEEWDDADATLDHFTQRYFVDEGPKWNLEDRQVKARVKQWLQLRDPQDVAWEIHVVDEAYRRREKQARLPAEAEFEDIDDDELEAYYRLDEEDKDIRARLWLSQNGKWLEESKRKAEEKELYNRTHGIDSSKPKTKRKRAQQARQPYSSAREAFEGLATQKKFSNRINYNVLRSMGLADEDGLQTMDDEKDDEKDDEGEKYDEDEDGAGGASNRFTSQFGFQGASFD
ncbi:transcription factor TFIIIB subunit brf1 [Saitozyma podzolica]|uniref:B-related factor 1 n=1 Tax=Saitozyma podzolica TaxID=1890683 RepID=A0A427YVR9_9TREE|nr:transcription factor TFIIIB subunit brf1 [Saitozyma podzolica]